MRCTNFGHCVQITFFPALFPVNCYLIRDDDGLTLIDAALPSSAPATHRAISRSSTFVTTRSSLGMPFKCEAVSLYPVRCDRCSPSPHGPPGIRRQRFRAPNSCEHCAPLGSRSDTAAS